ncbi:hypothetical protein [Peptostreptococcus faecalis]|uniref:hypothetical protein n=1 Tax=Peptostreptococcus faecalis TaxID=2045015 RepID=UPI000C7B3C48|nr:hypothetical protein [Peptostreptococcus faecalis]
MKFKKLKNYSNDALVQVYTKGDKESFNLGYILKVTKKYLLLESVSSGGSLLDGYLFIPINCISKIKDSSDYIDFYNQNIEYNRRVNAYDAYNMGIFRDTLSKFENENELFDYFVEEKHLLTVYTYDSDYKIVGELKKNKKKKLKLLDHFVESEKPNKMSVKKKNIDMFQFDTNNYLWEQYLESKKGKKIDKKTSSNQKKSNIFDPNQLVELYRFDDNDRYFALGYVINTTKDYVLFEAIHPCGSLDSFEIFPYDIIKKAVFNSRYIDKLEYVVDTNKKNNLYDTHGLLKNKNTLLEMDSFDDVFHYCRLNNNTISLFINDSDNGFTGKILSVENDVIEFLYYGNNIPPKDEDKKKITINKKEINFIDVFGIESTLLDNFS